MPRKGSRIQPRDEAHAQRLERQRAYRAANRERLAELQRGYLKRHPDEVKARKRAARAAMTPEQRDQEREYHRERYTTRTVAQRERQREHERKWRAENREAINAKRRQKHREAPEAARASFRRWRERNVEAQRARWRAYYAANRAAMIARASARRMDPEWVVILAGDPCSYCGGPCEHIDHITAHAAVRFIQSPAPPAACADCNRRKHTKSLLGFLCHG